MRKLIAFLLIFAASAAAQTAPPSINSVVNVGSNDARFCDGLLVAIVGNNFGGVAGSVSVSVGGQTAGVVDVNNSVIHAQLPLTLGSVPTTMIVNVAGQNSGPFSMTIDSYAPAFYGSPAVTPNPASPGQTVTATLVGLGATNPLSATGTTPATPLPTSVTPVVTVGGTPATVTASALTTTAVGVYAVSFIMPSTAVVGTQQDLILTIGGKAAPKMTITVAPPAGGPAITAITNAGSGVAAFSAGALVNVAGQNFNSPTVTVGSKIGFVVQSTSTNVLVELPVDLPIGPTTLTVSSLAQTSTPFNLNIDPFAPAFYGTFRDTTGASFSSTNPASPGRKVIAQLVGLGATNPGVPTGQSAGSQAPTVSTPTLTIGGKGTTFSYCGLAPGLVGVYELDFTVPPDVAAGSLDVILTIAGVATPAHTLVTATILPTLVGFKNAASGQLIDATHGIAPNTFLSIYATNLGSTDSTGNLFPAKTFQGDQVSFNATPAPLYNVIPSANLINLVVPSELPETGTATVAIANPNGSSQNFTLNLASTNVGIFRIPADASNPTRQIAAATIANTAWLVLPASTVTAYNYAPCPAVTPLLACAGPAHPGDHIVIYFTGGGKATPNGNPAGQPVATGSVAPADGSLVYQTVIAPTLTIGGIQAHIDFSGIAPGTAAEYQINTTIPTGIQPSDDVAVVLTIGNSSDTVTIAVR